MVRLLLLPLGSSAIRGALLPPPTLPQMASAPLPRARQQQLGVAAARCHPPAACATQRIPPRGRRPVLRARPASNETECLCPGGVPCSSLRVAVLGGGNFGTAIACVLARKGVPVTLIVRKDHVAKQINEEHTNPYYQSELILPPTVYATTDAASALCDADFVFHAVPVQFSREVLRKVAPLIPEGVPVISLSKGIETDTLYLMCGPHSICFKPMRLTLHSCFHASPPYLFTAICSPPRKGAIFSRTASATSTRLRFSPAQPSPRRLPRGS